MEKRSVTRSIVQARASAPSARPAPPPSVGRGLTLKRLMLAPAVFILVAALLTGCLTLSAMIPRSAIEKHMRQSADFLCAADVYPVLARNVKASRVDRYADSVLLGIAWQLKADDPFRSAMGAGYYSTYTRNVNQDLRAALDIEPEYLTLYMRYWHGSLVIVRPLLILTNLVGIYCIMAAALALLTGSLLIRLALRRAWGPLAGLAIGLAGVSIWYVPWSLEYVWVFLILFVQMHLTLCRHFPKTWGSRALFFMVSGMVTAYLDFLTTETLTLLVPLMLILWRDKAEARTPPPALRTLAGMGAAWLAGYGGMFLLKWGLASAVLGFNALAPSVGRASIHIGTSSRYSFGTMLVKALARNLGCLFPLEWGAAGPIIAAALVLGAIYVGYTRRREDFDGRLIACFALMALVPYLRFLALTNHALVHYFFAYRAQLSTIFAAALILEELIRRRWPA